MMPRVICLAVDDLALDPAGLAATLNTACNSRRTKHTVRGVCQVEDRLYFVLTPRAARASRETYVLAPVPETEDASFTAELASRWAAGFTVLATLQVGGEVHALYARTEASGR